MTNEDMNPTPWAEQHRALLSNHRDAMTEVSNATLAFYFSPIHNNRRSLVLSLCSLADATDRVASAYPGPDDRLPELLGAMSTRLLQAAELMRRDPMDDQRLAAFDRAATEASELWLTASGIAGIAVRS